MLYKKHEKMSIYAREYVEKKKDLQKIVMQNMPTTIILVLDATLINDICLLIAHF